ncbi:MAG TPA: LPS assembly protein LptD [Terriglobia bacterium]|nr:LPS assembly protein LptD [Terriglobia bacterium]
MREELVDNPAGRRRDHGVSKSVLSGAWLALLCVLAGPPASAQQPEIPAEFKNPFNTVTVYADSQQAAHNILTLTGHVEIDSRGMSLVADEAVYDQSTGEIDARGHIAFTNPKAYLEAASAKYNVKTEVGVFSKVHGYLRLEPRASRVRVTVPMSNAFYIEAREVDREGPDTYRLVDGRISSCQQKERLGWWLNVHSAQVNLGGRAVSHGDVFHFLGLPMFYAPVLVHSASRTPRQTGFLLPEVGNSTLKGRILGDAFYWAINRSADLMAGAEDYSSRGTAFIGRFRARPSDTSSLEVNYLQVNDHGTGPLPTQRAPGEDLRAVGGDDDLGWGFRGVVDVDYINSLAFRLTWSGNFNEAVTSEARQTGFATKSFDGYNLSFYGHRYEDFLNSVEVPNPAVIIRQTPSINFGGMDHELGSSPFYLQFDASAAGVGREEPGFSTPALTERLDFHPELTMQVPEFWGFHLTPTAGLDGTRYGTSLLGPQNPINRLLGEASLDLHPPTLERVFNRRFRHYRLKNVIEPDIRYRLVRASDAEQISDIIRFDETDVFTETNEIEYSLKSTLYGRADAGSDPTDTPQARELMSLSVSQKYYFDPTFGGVLKPGANNVWEPTLDLTGFAFADGQRLSPVVSVFKVAPFSNYDTEVRADVNPYDGGLLDAGITSSVHRGNYIFEATDFFVDREQGLNILPLVLPVVPTSALSSSNLMNARFIWGHSDRKGLSGAVGVNYNITAGLADGVVGQLTYNFSCFGIDVGYNRFYLGPLRDENQFRIAITLSNVGSFGNLKGRDRLFTQNGLTSQ